MKEKNTINLIEFIIYHIWWMIVAWMWYKILLFRCLGEFSFKATFWLLLGCLLGCSIVGTLYQWRTMRNHFSILTNLVLGYGIFTVILYFPIQKKIIKTVLLISTFLALAYTIMFLFRKIKSKRNRKRIITRRIICVALGVRNIFCIGLIALMSILFINSVLGVGIVKPSVATAKKSDIEEWTISNHLDKLSLLYDDTWKTLSIEEKLNVLQIVANIEQNYLGLPNELNVGAEDLQEKKTLGYYDDSRHVIIVSIDRLLNDSSYNALKTVAHEAYHSYQYRIIEAYEEANDNKKSLFLYNDAVTYKEEFAKYSEVSKDFCSYYTLKCEEDSRRWAEVAVREYAECIYEYLGLSYLEENDETEIIHDEDNTLLDDDFEE